MICIYSRSATLSSKNGNPIPGLPKPRPTSRLSQITAQPLREDNEQRWLPNTASLPYVVHEQRKHLHLDLHMKVKFKKSLHSQKFGSLWLVCEHCCFPHVFHFASRLHGRDNIPTWKRKQTVELICFMDVRELTIKQGMFSSIVNYTNKSNSLGILNCSPWPCFISCHSKMCLSTQLRWATTLTRTSTQDNNSNGFEGSMSLISRPHSWEPPRLNQVQKLPPFQPLLQPSGCWSLGRLNFCSSVNAMLIRLSFEDGKIRYLEPETFNTSLAKGCCGSCWHLNSLEDTLDWTGLQKKRRLTDMYQKSQATYNIQPCWRCLKCLDLAVASYEFCRLSACPTWHLCMTCVKRKKEG